MNDANKKLLIGVVIALVVGFLAGFVPEHMANSNLQTKVQALNETNGDVNGHLSTTQNKLALSNFAVRAAVVLADADRNNYSVASTDASSLFTDMRKYVDGTSDASAKDKLSQVLEQRDRTIAGLAQANPGTKGLLLDIFLKTQDASAQAMAGK